MAIFLAWLPAIVTQAESIPWLNPAPGVFQDGAFWLGGAAPGPLDEPVFGLNPAESVFVVTFEGNVINRDLAVVNQRPTFALGGFTWTLSGNQRIGIVAGMSPTIRVSNGSLHTRGLGASTRIAVGAQTSGQVIVDGAQATWSNHGLWVGDGGRGILEVLNGGQALAEFASFATREGSSAEVRVAGLGSALDVVQVVELGQGGSAAMEIHEGGALRVTSWLRVGTSLEPNVGTSSLVLYGSDSTATCRGLTVGSNRVGQATPNGIVTLLNGGRVEIGELGAFVFQHGRVTGDGTLDVHSSALLGNFGFFQPGAPIGVLNIDGRYFQGPNGSALGEGTMAIEIGGPVPGKQHDQLVVTGNANLAGRLEIELVAGFEPNIGDTFEVLRYGSRSGMFETIIGQALGEGKRFALHYRTNGLTLEVCAGDAMCDDCNLNGIPDGQDIANKSSQDLFEPFGVPDECAQFIGECEMDTDWSCTQNWLHLVKGDPYPNNGANRYNVTLDTNKDLSRDDVFLDVSVTIDSLRILEGSRLRVSQSGDMGELRIETSQGLLVESELQIGNGRTIDVPDGLVLIGPGGVLQPDPQAGEASGTLKAKNLTLTRGTQCSLPCPEADGGTLILEGSMSAVVMGDLMLDGTGASSCTDSGGLTRGAGDSGLRGFIQDPPRGRIYSSLNVMGILTLRGPSEWNVGWPGLVTLSGNFDNQHPFPNCFDWSEGRAQLNSRSGQTFEVAGRDLGSTQAGYASGTDTNFSMGGVEVVPLADVTFVNHFINTDGVSDCSEALYVQDLTLRGGAKITVDNVRVYYLNLVNEGATVMSVGCGALVPVPPCVTSADCSDGNGCTTDRCSPSGLCVHLNHRKPCDDGLYCTKPDVCSEGVCVGSPRPCLPGLVCDEELNDCVPADR